MVAAGSSREKETWPALKVAAADPAAAAEAGRGDDEEGLPQALKAAAADPKGAFTAATAEAGENDEEEEPPAALKAATADPTGAFTAVTAEAGGTAPGGWERVSATMLLTPAMWRMSEVYSATYERWRACLAVHGSETAEGVGEGLVVSKNGKPPPFQHVMEMADPQRASQELSIKGRVLGLSWL
jgi:hypothetical protein